ncbi:MAG: sigma-70 family RNA polymerase sigma factor [Gemmatimonadales bacterium]|jgi:RNA polymerase sigma-70 factor (ECF subfamily)|nr:MAG: sigma-70 family RNA polymerase sigma factor [Gemmatimonadales bacterium]
MPVSARSRDSEPEAGRTASSTPDVPALVARVQAGDIEAFEPLYRHHVDRVYALCLRMAGHAGRARELTQDVFVRCWERIGSFRGESAFGTWLHRVAVNLVLEQHRATGRREGRVEPRADLENLPHVTLSRTDDQRLDLEAAIQALPPKARQVFVLHDIEGYTHDEIARFTGSAPGTMRAHLHRARQLLMKRLS